jgi:glucokinase
MRIWQEVGRDLGLGLANLVNLLNPERIVIGGGMARAWPWFRSSLLARMRQLAFEAPAKAVRVVRAKLGDRAGIVGAAVLVWEQTRNSG